MVENAYQKVVVLVDHSRVGQCLDEPDSDGRLATVGRTMEREANKHTCNVVSHLPTETHDNPVVLVGQIEHHFLPTTLGHDALNA